MKGVRKYSQVIKIDQYSNAHKICLEVIHYPLKSCGGVLESEGEALVVVEAERSDESCFILICWVELNLAFFA